MNPFVRFTAVGKIFPNKYESIAYDAKFIYIHSGNGTITINGNPHSLDNGTLCYIPPANRYLPFISNESTSKFTVINFDLTTEFSDRKEILYPVSIGEFNPDFALICRKNNEFEMYETPFVCQKAFFIEDLIKTVVKEFEKKTKYSYEIASSYLKCVILNLAQFKNDKDHSLYSKIEEYISQNYASLTSDKDIAKSLNYHPYHISRVLKEHSGLTLHKYVVKYRIKRACELLRNTNLTINQISKKVGYENQNQFSNIFSRETGISPTEYRKMNLFF